MDGIPAQVVEVLGRTGMRGEASSVKVRVLDGDDRGRIIRRNVVGPVDIGDQLLLLDSSREAKALADSIDFSKNCTKDIKGILGHILTFCGYPFKVISFTYASIRHILQLMLKNIFALAGEAIALAKPS